MRLSRPLLRRIDRLSRRAHAFHRFAHHPLCDQYAGELIALRGRTRVCRGCTAALVGGLAGATLAIVCALPLAATVIISTLTLLIAMVLLSSRAGVGPRRSKLWTRALPTGLLAAGVVTALRAPTLSHVGFAVGLIALSRFALSSYRRRGPDRSPCQVCPERHLSVPCTGFRSIVRAERAFVRRSERLLDAAISGERHAP